MKNLNLIVGLCCLLLTVLQANASSNSCTSPQPGNFEQVFQCISTQGSQSFTNAGQMNCSQIKQQYLGLLRRAGAKSDLVDQPPSCSTFAKIALEVSGQQPFWQSCLNYDGSKQHLTNCLGGMLHNSSNKIQTILGSCPLLTMMYQNALLSASEEPRKPALPDTYTEPDCDIMLQAISDAGIDTKGAECSGFTANDIQGHMKKCLSADQEFRVNIDKIDCNSLRNYYQVRLQLAYGKMPTGYKMLRCSELNLLLLELKQTYAAKSVTENDEAMAPARMPQPENSTPLVQQNTPSNAAQNIDEKGERQNRLAQERSKLKASISNANTQSTGDIARPHKDAVAAVTIDSNGEPQLISKSEPNYPMRAQSQGIEGWVKLGFDVNEQGRVENINVISAEPKRVFDRSAKRALSSWKYKPATVNGKAIKTTGLQETIKYSL